MTRRLSAPTRRASLAARSLAASLLLGLLGCSGQISDAGGRDDDDRSGTPGRPGDPTRPGDEGPLVLPSVATLNYNFSGHGQPGVPGYHDHTHPGGFARAPNGTELADLDGLSRFQIQMLAHLLRELADYGVLNDTLVVYCPHERPTHDHDDVPVIAINAPRPGTRASNLRVTDLNRDVLAWAGVPGADDFGGERSRGGVL